MKPKIEAREWWIKEAPETDGPYCVFEREISTEKPPTDDTILWGDFENCTHVIEAQPALARIAELEAEVELLQADGVHTCHSKCQRIACVQRRKIVNLEATIARLKSCVEFYFGLDEDDEDEVKELEQKEKGEK